MALHVYKLKDGTRVPGVTTVIGRFKDAGGLIHWSWTVGMEGKDYRELRDHAADAGTCAHAMVEADIRGKDFDPSPYPADVVALAQGAFGAYKEWATQTRLKPVETEVSLVSERHRYGGTLDAMLVQDKLALGDWKTGNRLYPEHLIQLAAYHQLWTENRPDEPIIGGFHLLRFSKDHGDFAHHYFADLSPAWRAFELMRELYDIDKELKKRV